MELCEVWVWNDVLHIKTFEIWETIFKSDLSGAEKFELLKTSGAVASVVAISKSTTVKYNSERLQRKGNMAFSIKLANLFKA